MRILSIIVLLCFISMQTLSLPFDTKKYENIDLQKIKATPEEYKNKKIFIETIFVCYETTFRPYVEKSGYKAGKHYYIQVRPANFPVMAEKNDTTNAIIPSLKAGSKIRVYGKAKKFSAEPQNSKFPIFYLELENIEVIEIGDGVISEEDKKDAFTPQQKQLLKNKNLK